MTGVQGYLQVHDQVDMGLALIHGETGYMDAAMHAAEKLVSEA